MLSSIRRRRPFRGNGPWIVIAAVAGRAARHAVRRRRRRGPPAPRRSPQPVAERVARVHARDADHRQQQHLRHPPVEQVDERRRRDLRLPRAAPARSACLRASNLSNGRAFSFATNSGTEVGRIDGPSTAAPFTTNATGVATGLNADKVDGKDADDIAARTRRRASRPSRSPRRGDGTLGAQRGRRSGRARPAPAPTPSRSPTTSRSARSAPTATTNAAPALATASSAADNKTVNVVTRDAAAAAAPADEPFHLTVTC